MGAFKNMLRSLFIRPFKYWNIENRAQKVIKQQKDNPKVAPRHQSSAKILQQFQNGVSSQCIWGGGGGGDLACLVIH